MRGIGIRSPFPFFNEDDIRNDALKKELRTLMAGLFPLLSRYAEIVTEQNLTGAQIQIATPSGIVFGIVNQGSRRMMDGIMPFVPYGQHPPFPHSHGEIFVDGDVNNVPPEMRAPLTEALERFLKNLKDRK